MRQTPVHRPVPKKLNQTIKKKTKKKTAQAHTDANTVCTNKHAENLRIRSLCSKLSCEK